MWHNRFSENENEALETHIPRYRDSKAKKPRHRETETINPQHRNSETFFQRTKSHDIEIPRLENHDIDFPRPKSHDIELRWNSDPYAPWYPRSVVPCSIVPALFRRSVGVPCSGVPGFIVCHQSWQSITLILTHLSENPFLSGFFNL